MDALRQLFDIVLHLNRHLDQLVADYGVWVYGLMFLIVFCETGLVVTPFLPGDSLLFAAGALAANGRMNIGLADRPADARRDSRRLGQLLDRPHHRRGAPAALSRA